MSKTTTHVFLIKKTHFKIMQRPLQGEFNPFFQRYIDLVPEGNFHNILNGNTRIILDFFQNIPSEKHEYRYEEGKWSIKEILIHIIDTERVMSYRALVAARGDTSVLPGFDENTYVQNVDVLQRTMESLLEEFQSVRNATTHFFSHISEAQSTFEGNANHHAITARALGYISVGHVLHHVNVVKERYL